jgi:hypothetical protein
MPDKTGEMLSFNPAREAASVSTQKNCDYTILYISGFNPAREGRK